MSPKNRRTPRPPASVSLAGRNRFCAHELFYFACHFVLLAREELRVHGQRNNLPCHAFGDGKIASLIPKMLVSLLLVNGNRDRKSTRLNSSHLGISYAVFCLKKKKIIED